MAESTLNLKLADLESKVGHYLGYGRGTNGSETAWTTYQQNIITDCVESGLRQFYTPPDVPGHGCYEWTFLQPRTTLGLASGKRVVSLPDDFGNLEGPIAVSSADSGVWQELKMTGDVQRRFGEQPTAVGAPLFCSIEALRGGTQNESQRFELQVYPEADQDYTLTLSYTVLENALTNARPYVRGGAAHAETIIESILSVAEARQNNQLGLHRAMFMERLKASIAHDIRLRPHHLGKNSDWNYNRRRSRQRWTDPLITIAGSDPT